MSRAFGEIFQVAYVVPDVEAAIDQWTTVMGVGPFVRFPLPLPLEWLMVDGQEMPADTDLLRGVALSYSGDTMIELIEPGSAPSTYRRFLDDRNRGVHHLGTFTDRYDEQMAAARANGIAVVLEGVLPLSRFAYLATDAVVPGPQIELIEPTREMRALFDTIKARAAEWDGRARVVDI